MAISNGGESTAATATTIAADARILISLLSQARIAAAPKDVAVLSCACRVGRSASIVRALGGERRLGNGILARLTVAVAALFCGIIAATCWIMLTDPKPVDFLSFWAAGRMVAEGAGAQIYDIEAHRAVERTVSAVGILPFPYPPPFALMLSPFGLLPFGLGFAAWVALTGAFYVCRGPSLDAGSTSARSAKRARERLHRPERIPHFRLFPCRTASAQDSSANCWGRPRAARHKAAACRHVADRDDRRPALAGHRRRRAFGIAAAARGPRDARERILRSLLRDALDLHGIRRAKPLALARARQRLRLASLFRTCCRNRHGDPRCGRGGRGGDGVAIVAARTGPARRPCSPLRLCSRRPICSLTTGCSLGCPLHGSLFTGIARSPPLLIWGFALLSVVAVAGLYDLPNMLSLGAIIALVACYVPQRAKKKAAAPHSAAASL